MLDIIKAILDTLKLVPFSDMATRHREERVAAIGLRLLDLYNLAVRIIENGHKIIESLDNLVRRHRYFYESGVSDSTVKAAFRMRPLLARQMRCIRDFLLLAGGLEEFANIVDKPSDQNFRRMQQMAWRKMLMYGFLDNEENDFRIDFNNAFVFMGRPFEYVSDELNRWTEFFGKPNFEPDHDEAVFAEINDFYAYLSALYETLGNGSANKIPWDQDTNNIMAQYIESGIPKRRLDIMAEAAASFKEDIQTHFKIDELLLAAERRAKRQSIERARLDRPKPSNIA
jgi:hypothetical protein